MEDQELRQTLASLEKKTDAIYAAVEKARKYLLVMIIITVVAGLMLPLIGFFATPSIFGLP